MVLKGNGRSYAEINRYIIRLKQLAKSFDEQKIKELLQELIPEYSPAPSKR